MLLRLQVTIFTTQFEFSSSAVSKPQQFKKKLIVLCVPVSLLRTGFRLWFTFKGIVQKPDCNHGFPRLRNWKPQNWKPRVDPAPAPLSRERLTDVALPRFPPGKERTSWNPDQDSDCRLRLPSLQLGKNAVMTSHNVCICCRAPRWSLNVPGTLCCSFQSETA